MTEGKPPIHVSVTVLKKAGIEDIKITPEGFFEPGEIEAFSYGLPEVRVRGSLYKLNGTPRASGKGDSSQRGFSYARDF